MFLSDPDKKTAIAVDWELQATGFLRWAVGPVLCNLLYFGMLSRCSDILFLFIININSNPTHNQKSASLLLRQIIPTQRTRRPNPQPILNAHLMECVVVVAGQADDFVAFFEGFVADRALCVGQGLRVVV
jgi:hypothetical protein